MADKNSKTKKRSSGSRKKAADNRLSPANQKQIIFFVLLAVMVFLFLSSFGICGTFGNIFAGFFFGVFGVITFILPLYVMFTTVLIMSNGTMRRAMEKIIWSGVLLGTVDFIFQLAHGCENATAGSLYMDGYLDKAGGGFIFGGLITLFYHLIKTPGCVIIIILLIIISLIEITEISFIDAVKGIGAFLRDRLDYINQGDPYNDDADDTDEEFDDGYSEGLTAARRRKRKEYDPDDLEDIGIDIDELDKKNFPEKKKKSILSSIEVLPDAPSAERASLPQPEEASKDDDDIANEAPKNEPGSIFRSIPKGKGKKNTGIFDDLSEDVVELRPDNSFDPLSSTSFPINGIDKRSTSEYDDPDDDYLQEDSDDDYDEEYIDPGRSANTAEGSDARSAGRASGEYAAAPGAPGDGSVRRSAGGSADGKIASGYEPAGKAEPSADTGKKRSKAVKPYRFPPLNLLSKGQPQAKKDSETDVRSTAAKLRETLSSFGVNVTITNCSIGPAVTRYEMQPEVGVKVSRITSLADDIKLALAAEEIRIEAPIPGKSAIGIEVPNKENSSVPFRGLIESKEYKQSQSKITFAVGRDISGNVVVCNLAKMPHLLIAGATGSGKSVCINTLIMSILYKAGPEDVQMIMIDPKMVELTSYNGIPHLIIPVVTDPKKAAGALNWAVGEMTRRYQLFAKYNVKNIKSFNKKVEDDALEHEFDDDPEFRHMTQIVIIIDELADLMMTSKAEVESAIVRLAQLARAAGIHLVIATQRPSVDVITGLIKANVPSRIAFAVSSGIDSRTILDMNGAENLLGKGDMLFLPTGMSKPERVQGAFCDDDEVLKVVEYIKSHNDTNEYDESVNNAVQAAAPGASSAGDSDSYDEYFEDAGRLIIEKDKATIGLLQRMFRIGFNRAARIMEQLCDAGVVGPEEGTKPRQILMTESDFEDFLDGK